MASETIVPSKKIYLPVVVLDNNQNERIKNILFDVEFLKGKNVRGWDKDGKDVDGKCVLFSTLKFSRNEDFTIINLSIDQYVEKMKKIGAIEIAS